MGNLPANQGQDDIIIKCSLEDIAKSFFKDYEIIWHDPMVNIQENQQYLAQLEKLCKIKTFTEWKEAESYIKTAKTICHVITSGTNGELLVKEIFSSANVPKIFTFCRAKDYHSTWTKDYEEVLCTETKIGDVILKIQENLLKWQKHISSLRLDLPAFAPIFNDWDKTQMNHLHLYLKVIPHFKNRAQAKNDFVTLSKSIYSDATNKKLIADFDQEYNEYNKDVILKWYTRQSFLYKVINNCLRIATSDSIQWSRFLLKDIERAIKDQYQTKSKDFCGLLYRAAYLPEKEWSSLKENVNREIEMHGFLSASKEKNIALKFMRLDPTRKVFITILVPDRPVEEEQGFAEIEEFSRFPKEKEVLFNVRSRFTVLEIEDTQSKDLPYRHLVLLYGAQSLRRFIAEKNPVQKVSMKDIEKTLCFHCKVLLHERSEKWVFISFANLQNPTFYCKKCIDENTGPFVCASVMANREESSTAHIKGCLLNNFNQTQLPFYGYKCSKCGVKKQKRYFVCTDCGGREKRWCQSCFEETLSCKEAGHCLILENFPFSFWCERMSENELNHLKFQNDLVKKNDDGFQLAEMYFKTHEYENAIEYYHLYLRRNEFKDKNSKLANAYNNVGLIYVEQGEYKKALEFHSKSLDIRKSVFGENHPDIATSYNNIGLVYENQGQSKQSLEYFLKSLSIRELVVEKNHPDIGSSYHTLGLAYESQRDHKMALEYYNCFENSRLQSGALCLISHLDEILLHFLVLKGKN